MGDKPIPVPTPESAPFWAAAKEGRLIYQFCTSCARAQYYPRILCSHCGSRELEWRDSTHRATIHALSQVHIGLPSFKADAPYVVVLVDIEEGFRMLVNVVGEGAADATIGDHGTIVFQERDGVAMPQFQRITGLVL